MDCTTDRVPNECPGHECRVRERRVQMDRIDEALSALDDEVRRLPPELQTWNTSYFAEHRRRYAFELSCLARFSTGRRVLEIGALPCHLSFLLKTIGYEYVGVDLRPARMRSFIERHALEIHACDIERSPLPFAANAHECLLFSETLEHLRVNPLFALREMARVLAPGGVLIVTTPNCYALARVVQYLSGKGQGDIVAEFAKLETVGHMGHIREYARAEVVNFLEYAGLTVLHSAFVSFTPHCPHHAPLRTRVARRCARGVCLVAAPLRSHLVVVAQKHL